MIKELNNNIIKRIYKSKLLLIIALIVFFEPQMFKEENFLALIYIDKVYKVLKLFFSVIILIIYLKDYKKTKLFFVMLLLQGTGLLATVINNGSIVRFIGPAITTITMILIAEMLIKDNEIIRTSRILNYYFRTCFIINVISIIAVDGFCIWKDDLYFLGIDNRWIFSYLPWMFFELISAENKNNYKCAYICFMLMELSLLYKWSVAAALINLLWIVVLVGKNKIHFTRYIIPVYIMTIFANISIVVLKIQNVFTEVLSKLGKDITLSGRTLLWDNVLKKIIDKPLLGNGMRSLEYDKMFFGSSSNTDLSFLHVGHAHNSYMTVLYRYGLIGLSFYLLIFIIPIIQLRKYYTNKYANIIFVGVLISLLLSIFDTIDCSALYFILACAFCIEKMN